MTVSFQTVAKGTAAVGHQTRSFEPGLSGEEPGESRAGGVAEQMGSFAPA